MTDNTYNGWTNKETWLVNLWLGDVLSVYQEEGQDITPEFIEGLVDDHIGETTESGFVKDLLNCSLGSINYDELASHYKPEEDEDEGEDE